MDYENYYELYEAVYFFDRFSRIIKDKEVDKMKWSFIDGTGINESVYHAVLRILVANDLLDEKDDELYFTSDGLEKYQHILNNIIKKDPHKQFTELYEKAVDPSHFFFDNISDSEYEIYSRSNFSSTFRIGKNISEGLDLSGCKVLEIGGNSGGFASGLLVENKDCSYTIVDTRIPCKIGCELTKNYNTNITFIEGNALELNLKKDTYDCIILMNFIHDFDDEKSMTILGNCMKYCDDKTRFLVIEDVLENPYEPKDVVMHGLRLAVECRGGRQRTKKEIVDLFSLIEYELEDAIKIDNVHTMMVMKPMA